jgi:hypothetical protein
MFPDDPDITSSNWESIKEEYDNAHDIPVHELDENDLPVRRYPIMMDVDTLVKQIKGNARGKIHRLKYQI